MELTKNLALRIAVIVCLNTVVFGYMFWGPQAEKKCFAAPPTAGTIDRSQNLIRGDEILTQKVGQEEQFFIDKIDIKGATKLSTNEVKNIISSLHGNWLSKKDFQQVVDSLKAAYVKKGLDTSRLKITYEVKKPGTLEVKVNELTQ